MHVAAALIALAAVVALPAMAQGTDAPSPSVPVAQALPELDPDAHFKGKMGGTFGKNIVEVLPAGKRVAVAGFRVAFVTHNSVSANVRASYLPGRDSSGARSSLHVALQGVDPAAMQAVTDKAYAALLAQLQQAGREVVPPAEMKDYLAGVDATPTSDGKPYGKEQQGQTVAFFSPAGLPLWFSHLDTGWGDRGAFDLANYRRLGEYSAKWNAIVIAPLVVVNFARMSSSGNTSGLTSRTAETGAELSMSVAGLTSYYGRAEEFRSGVIMKGDEGGFNLAAPIASPLAFGTLKQTAAEDNQAVKGLFDTLGKLAGLANAGGAAASTSRNLAETSNAAYSAAALDALGRTTGTLARWFQKYPAP
jgi:hypothetical protein